MTTLEEAINRLAEALKETEDYRDYQELREIVLADEASAALLRRYRSAQTALQLDALAGKEPSPEDVTAFEGLSAMLYANPDTADYLLLQMRMQQLVADIMKQLTTAAQLDMTLPEL